MRDNDHDIIDYIREHGCVTSGRIMFFMDQDIVRWDDIKEVDVTLTRLVSEKKLIVSTNGFVFRLPYGHYRNDCEFDIQEDKRASGESVWGVRWHSGGESWSWDTYGMALDYARDLYHRPERPPCTQGANQNG